MKHQILQGIKRAVYAPLNLTLRAVGKPLKPRWLMFAVTDRCNSRCKHCDIWRKKPAEHPLKPEEIERMLSDPLFEGVEYILNSGGEPTVRSDLEEVFLAEHKALPKARLQLSTNGLLPERVIDLVKFAIKNDIKIDVGTSLDGIGEKHDLIRGVKGNFEKVDRLLRELTSMKRSHEDKLRVSAGFVLSDLTLHLLPEVRTYLREFNIEPLVQWYNEAVFYSHAGKAPVANSDKLIEAIELLPRSPTYELWLKALKGKPIKFPCFAMHTFCALHCDGDIVPCLRFWNVKAGNVREASLTSTWHSPAAEEARKTVKNCNGCLNEWGVGWSFQSCFYPYLLFYLKHPHSLKKYLGEM